LNDSERRCLEAAIKLQRVFETWDMKFEVAFYFPDRNSEIMAHIIATKLEISDVKEWPKTGTDQPGLIVAYDFSKFFEDKTLIKSTRFYQKGQVLFSHCLNWVEPSELHAPDIVTYLYEMNTSPWDPQMQLDNDSKGVTYSKAIEDTPEVLAAKVSNLKLEYAEASKETDDTDLVISLAKACATLDGEHKCGAMHTSGKRPLFRKGSPVPSSSFAKFM